jgi:ubiquinone/menaquinone biosynthesis C-methylase UbiE
MSNLAYHLSELEIARTPDHPQHIMPALPLAGLHRVLDLGCGIGQTLLHLQLNDGTLRVGVDIDANALAYGKTLAGNLHLACAGGESLPFADDSFDAVIARVSLPYTHLPSSLGEIARVLKPGQPVWFSLHSFSLSFSGFGQALLQMNVKVVVFQLYVLVNSLLFCLTGRQFRYPFKRSRCESFQTAGGMKRALRAAGFDQTSAHHGRFFIMTAVKRAA